MNAEVQAQRDTAAHYVLEGLNELGIEYLFCNLGTDHAPLIEEMARWKRAGKHLPKTVLCPHENVAVHMAAGYAVATGRGQAVMVHVDVGTTNAALGMHNLFRTRIPVLLIAGRSPHTLHGELTGSRDTYVHFVQEPFDQGSLVRPYVKWEYTLPTGVVAKEALRRAHSVMHSDPRGPAYLMLPRETLAERCPAGAAQSFPEERYGPVAAGGADPERLSVLADKLLAAQDPLLITAYAGRTAEAVALIDELARFAGIRVVESTPVYLNIPHDSPCFGGFLAGEWVRQADIGLLVDVDVPWIPAQTTDNPATFWAHIDVDVQKRAFPMWGFPSNLRIEGDSGRILAQLLEALKARATPEFVARAARRVERLGRERQARGREAAERAADRGSHGRLNPQYVCAELGRAIAPEDVVLNEAIRNAPAVLAQIPRSRPGSLVGSGGGGLGFSGGMALGVKLARPRDTVVQVVGDGAFYFGNPEAVYAVSRQYRLPIFTVVLDNSGWAAVKAATLRVYPDGAAKALDEYECVLAAGVEFSKIAEAAGAYGEVLDDPAALPEAIRRCLAEVRGGRSAVLHVRIAPL